MKFKVGDKIKVIESSYNDWNVAVGETYTILYVWEKCYGIDGEAASNPPSDGWTMYESEMELATPEIVEDIKFALKYFTKDYDGVTEPAVDAIVPAGANKDATADMKPRMRFVHPDTSIAIAKAHMAGDVKYPALPEADRTESGILNFMQIDPNAYLSLSSLLEAIERHLNLIKVGEWYDGDCCDRLGPKTVTHLGCMGAGLNMIHARLAAGNLEDDRPYIKPKDRLE